jgi:hypothetical protein
MTNKEFNYDNIRIYQKDKTDSEALAHTKKDDRYSFTFFTKQYSKSKPFVVSSLSNIIILPDSKYPGHIITGSYWIDFQTAGINDVKINRISAYEVEVTTTATYDKKNWVFESIGKLNCVAESVAFFSVNSTMGYDPHTLVGATNQFTLSVSYNSSYITAPITAKLYYNNVPYTATASLSNDRYNFTYSLGTPIIKGNYSLYWNYTIDGTTYMTGTGVQEVMSINIGDCSTYGTKFVNYTFRDEIGDSIKTGSASALFSFISGSYTGKYNSSFSNVPSFSE